MTKKKEKVAEKIDIKDFQVETSDLDSKAQQVTSESVGKVDEKEFQRSIESLQSKTQRIVYESSERMKKYRI